MNKSVLSLCIAFTCFTSALRAVGAEDTKLQWHDLKDIGIEGKGWTDTKTFYDRLPARAEGIVRAPVWSLSQNSAGMCAHFITDAPTISARWILRSSNLDMPHMPSSGVSGVDLYIKEKDGWHWAAAGRPKDSVTNEVTLLTSLPSATREFLLYLPLYNGVRSVQIGVPPGTKITPANRSNKKPIVFYGTSILHGGCASRPGLAYPAIVGRKLDWPVINLGFSGNAKSEPEVADLLSELDPILFVLDPLPNMDAASVNERIEPMVKKLRAAHPTTPIVLVESVHYTDGAYSQTRYERYTTSNAALREVFKRLKKDGLKNLHYIEGDKLLGSDGEGTVDGTHPNDLGFMRMSEVIEPVLRKILKAQR